MENNKTDQSELIIKSISKSFGEFFTETALETSQTITTMLESADDTKTHLKNTEKQLDIVY